MYIFIHLLGLFDTRLKKKMEYPLYHVWSSEEEKYSSVFWVSLLPGASWYLAKKNQNKTKQKNKTKQTNKHQQNKAKQKQKKTKT